MLTTSPGPWQEYFPAVRRKVLIAQFHLERLVEVMPPGSQTKGAPPPIPVQAYFEGVVMAVIAAIDQVAETGNKAWGLRLGASEVVKEVFTRFAEKSSDVAKWFNDPFGDDLRGVRRLMAHHWYRKTAPGSPWVVQRVGNSRWQGSRELLPYAQRAVAYGNRLEELLPQIEAIIATEHRPLT